MIVIVIEITRAIVDVMILYDCKEVKNFFTSFLVV